MNLHQYYHILILKKSEVIIAGYFNINLLKINEKEYCSEFYDTLTGFSFFPKITFPTRFSSLNGTLIDNLFCKISELMLESTAGILIKQFSDHHPYFIFSDNAPVQKCPPKLIKIHIFFKHIIFTKCSALDHYLRYVCVHWWIVCSGLWTCKCLLHIVTGSHGIMLMCK